MSFADELNNVTKFPEAVLKETEEKLYKKAIGLCNSDYECIKSMFKSNASNGEYEIVQEKKKIQFYYKGNLGDLLIIKSEIKTIKKLFSSDTQFNTIIYAKDRGFFDRYKNELIKLGNQDEIGIDIVGVRFDTFTCSKKVIQEFEIPGKLIGTSSLYVDSRIKCVMYY